MSITTTAIENIPLITSSEQGGDVPVHYLPFTLDYRGPAKVSSFFMPHTPARYENSLLAKDIQTLPTPVKNTSDFQTASFRGRELTGRDVNQKEFDCVGQVVTTKDGKRTRHEVTSSFNKMTVWYPDQSEVRSDCVTKALSYTNYLQILHSDE